MERCQISTFLFDPKDGWVEKTDGDEQKERSETLQEPDFDPSHSHLSTSPSQRGDTQ